MQRPGNRCRWWHLVGKLLFKENPPGARAEMSLFLVVGEECSSKETAELLW
jgi:hypothetical protein